MTRGLLENFLNSNFEWKDQSAILDAVKSLQAKSQYSEPKSILPVDEVELRRDYASRIENRLTTSLPDFELTSVHLAAIMITPLINLERGGYLSPQNLSVHELAARLRLVSNLVKRYLVRKFEKEIGPATNQKRPQLHTASSRKSRYPGLTQKELCRARDQYRCLFLQTAEGDVAHIIPHSWNKNQGNVDMTKLVIPTAQVFMDHQLFSKYQMIFADERSSLSTDKIWNMLYLNKQHHWYFDHGSIAFKCLGIERHNDTDDKADVLIQIHWLNRTKINPKKIVTCLGDANDLDKMIDGLRQFEDQGFPARIEPDEGLYTTVRANNYVPVISGHYVRVTMSSEDAEKCQAMLQLSWGLSVVAAMNGSAESPDLLPDHDDWEEIEQQASVENWVQDQAQRYEQLREVDLLSGAADLGTPETLQS
ncbi:hypothetical protein FSST1_000303 [Fusarium sambucinum]